MFFAAAVVSLLSCAGLTEYDLAFSGGVHVLCPLDFSTIATVTGITGARSLLVYPDGLLIATTDGIVYSYSLDACDLIGEYTVGSPSPAGYIQMAYSSLEDTAYLVGSMGKILEISLPDCDVLDEFSICQSPVKLVVASGSSYIFVVDGPSNRIYQASIENNKPYTSAAIYFTVNCIEPCQNPDSMLIGTSTGISLLEILGPGALRSIIVDESVPCIALVAVPDDTVFIGVKGHAGALTVGVVDVFNIPAQTPPLSEYYGEVGIEGNSPFLSIGQDGSHAYVLSHIGNSMSSLVSYNYITNTIDQQTDIPGFPLDLKVSEDGTIFALTTE